MAGIAWTAGTLTVSGLLAAWLVGLLILWGTGWEGGVVLAAFFVSSNLVSRLARPASTSVPRRDNPPLDAKSDRRDAWQVCANGGPAAVAAVFPLGATPFNLWLVTASLAAAAADTWATSVGLRSRTPPRLWWFGPTVRSGTNGGMTALGTLAAVIGAALVAGTGTIVTGLPALLPVGTLIGFVGMVLDSLLGGAAQGRFHCPRCGEPSEWRVHRCGTRTRVTGGWPWLNNDGVNFLTTAFGAGAGWIIWWLRDGLS